MGPSGDGRLGLVEAHVGSPTGSRHTPEPSLTLRGWERCSTCFTGVGVTFDLPTSVVSRSVRWSREVTCPDLSVSEDQRGFVTEPWGPRPPCLSQV